MEHISRAISHKCLLHTSEVGDIADDEVNFCVGMVGLHEELQVVHRSFGLVDKDYFFGAKGCNLVYNFRSDGAGRAGNHNHLVAYHLLYIGGVGLNHVTAKEIFDADAAHGARGAFAIFVEFSHAIVHKQFDVVAQENVGHAGAHQFELR